MASSDTRRDEAFGIAAAERALAEGTPAQAVEILERVLASRPNSARARYLLGVARFRHGDADGATVAFRAVTEDHPGDHRAWYALALAAERTGDRATAATALRRCLDLRPDLAEVRDRLAALEAEGRADDGAGTTLAAQLDDAERDVADDTLLRSGRRRVSSVLGSALGGAALGLLGTWLTLTRPVGLARTLARTTMLGRGPDFYRDRLALIPAFDERSLTAMRADLASAEQTLAERTSQADGILDVAGVLLVVLGIVVVLWAVLGALATRYDIYRHHFDVTRGILSRRTDTMWLYEVDDVTFEQPIWLLVTGNARVVLRGDDRTLPLVGLAPAREMRGMWRELRDHALRERRAMRRWWV